MASRTTHDSGRQFRVELDNKVKQVVQSQAGGRSSLKLQITIPILITLTLMAVMFSVYHFVFLHPMMLENEKQTNITLTMMTSAASNTAVLKDELDEIREKLTVLSQAFNWDDDQCSNTHVNAEERSIILKAKTTDDLFCQAINRGVRAGNDTAYSMTVDFNNLMGQPGNYGNLGFAFNLQDDVNYDFVYKRYSVKCTCLTCSTFHCNYYYYTTYFYSITTAHAKSACHIM